MKSFNSLVSGFAVSVALVGAAPAFAAGSGSHDRLASVSLPTGIARSSSACGTGPAPARCGEEQSRLLEAVAKMARQEKPDATQRDISRRQLNALIASIN